MDKEQKAFERLGLGAEMSKQYYNAPLIICYSGGKDSDVLVQLALNSGIDFEVLHNHTTADAPETVRHICDTFKRLELQGIKCTVEYPVYKGKRTSMWDLIPQKLIPPTRIMRYCCSILKEKGGQHRAIATGVRWAESQARIFLRITDVRVERLQDITEKQASEEGCIDNRGFIHSYDNEYDTLHTAREHFTKIWDSAIKKTDLGRYGWNANPWVWVIEFERLEAENE